MNADDDLSDRTLAPAAAVRDRGLAMILLGLLKPHRSFHRPGRRIVAMLVFHLLHRVEDHPAKRQA
jgi:hypothetical protein